MNVSNMDGYQYILTMYVGSQNKAMTFMLDTGMMQTWISIHDRYKCQHILPDYNCGKFKYSESTTKKPSAAKVTITYGSQEI